MKRQISCSLVVVIALSLIIAFAPAIGKAEAAQPTVALNDYLLSVEKEGIDIDKKKIVLPDVIKSVGVYDVTVKPYAEISAKIKVKVEAL